MESKYNIVLLDEENCRIHPMTVTEAEYGLLFWMERHGAISDNWKFEDEDATYELYTEVYGEIFFEKDRDMNIINELIKFNGALLELKDLEKQSEETKAKKENEARDMLLDFCDRAWNIFEPLFESKIVGNKFFNNSYDLEIIYNDDFKVNSSVIGDTLYIATDCLYIEFNKDGFIPKSNLGHMKFDYSKSIFQDGIKKLVGCFSPTMKDDINQAICDALNEGMESIEESKEYIKSHMED